jgi:hypothetical protein
MLVRTGGALGLRRRPRHAVTGLVVVLRGGKALVITWRVSLRRVHIRHAIAVGTSIMIHLLWRVSVTLLRLTRHRGSIVVARILPTHLRHWLMHG